MKSAFTASETFTRNEAFLFSDLCLLFDS